MTRKPAFIYANTRDAQLHAQIKELLRGTGTAIDELDALAARVVELESLTAAGGEEDGGGGAGTDSLDIRANVRTVYDAHTVVAQDNVVLCDGTFTVTMLPAKLYSGKTIWVKNAGSGDITIAANGSDTVETTSLAAGKAAQLMSNGIADWYDLATD